MESVHAILDGVRLSVRQAAPRATQIIEGLAVLLVVMLIAPVICALWLTESMLKHKHEDGRDRRWPPREWS